MSGELFEECCEEATTFVEMAKDEIARLGEDSDALSQNAVTYLEYRERNRRESDLISEWASDLCIEAEERAIDAADYDRELYADASRGR